MFRLTLALIFVIMAAIGLIKNENYIMEENDNAF